MTAPDELRASVVTGLEELQRDMLIGKHGDPHLAFVVLLHPDEPPGVVALIPQGAYRFEELRTRDDHDDDKKYTGPDDRTFTWAELKEAEAALASAGLAASTYPHRKDQTVHLGEHLAAEIKERWERDRARPIEQALARAAKEAEPRCEGCGNRYRTERGLTMHQQRTCWPKCKEALAARTTPPTT